MLNIYRIQFIIAHIAFSIYGRSLPEVINYTISVIEHLSSVESGIFNCVFYEMNSDSPDNLLTQLMSSHRISHIPKIVGNRTFKPAYSDHPNKPSLMVIHVGAEDPSNVRNPAVMDVLLVWNPSTRVLVLVDLSQLAYITAICTLLYYGNYHRTVLLGTSHRQIIWVDIEGNVDKLQYSYPHPAELFRDAVDNLKGKTVSYTAWYTNTRLIIQPNGLQGPFVEWVKETVHHLNGTPRYSKHPCPKLIEPIDKCYQEYFLSNEIDISLDHFGYIGLTPMLSRTLFGVHPFSMTILVPNGRPLNILELFVRPFTLPAWLLMVIAIVTLEATKLVAPNLFRNDPILLAICGIERYNLHNAGPWERLVSINLIIFFFIMSSAYESKLIAFMTHRPSTGAIETLDEFLHSGLKLKVDTNNYPAVLNDSVLSPLVVHGELPNLDDINAYYAHSEGAMLFTRLPVNYDFTQGRWRYVTLSEMLNLQVTAFMLAPRSPLLERLYWTQRIFFETGLMIKWQKKIWAAYSIEQHWKNANLDLSQLNDEILRFEDLLVAWISLGIGYVVCSMVFMVEILVNRSKRRRAAKWISVAPAIPTRN